MVSSLNKLPETPKHDPRSRFTAAPQPLNVGIVEPLASPFLYNKISCVHLHQILNSKHRAYYFEIRPKSSYELIHLNHSDSINFDSSFSMRTNMLSAWFQKLYKINERSKNVILIMSNEGNNFVPFCSFEKLEIIRKLMERLKTTFLSVSVLETSFEAFCDIFPLACLKHENYTAIPHVLDHPIAASLDNPKNRLDPNIQQGYSANDSDSYMHSPKSNRLTCNPINIDLNALSFSKTAGSNPDTLMKSPLKEKKEELYSYDRNKKIQSEVDILNRNNNQSELLHWEHKKSDKSTIRKNKNTIILDSSVKPAPYIPVVSDHGQNTTLNHATHIDNSFLEPKNFQVIKEVCLNCGSTDSFHTCNIPQFSSDNNLNDLSSNKKRKPYQSSSPSDIDRTSFQIDYENFSSSDKKSSSYTTVHSTEHNSVEMSSTETNCNNYAKDQNQLSTPSESMTNNASDLQTSIINDQSAPHENGFMEKPTNEFYSLNYGPLLVGLENDNLICYMNSIIQSLFSIHLFRSFIIDVSLTLGPAIETCKIISLLSFYLERIIIGQDRPLPMTKMKEAVFSVMTGLEVGVQQDAHEFLILLIDAMERDIDQILSHVPNSFTDIETVKILKHRFNKLFYGTIHYIFECEKCDGKSNIQERFINITIPLIVEEVSDRYKSLESYIKYFFSSEYMINNYAWVCEKCRRSESRQRLYVQELPLILIFHTGRNTCGGNKIMTKFEYPHDQFTFTVPMERISRTFKYTLMSVVHHRGVGIFSGHYTAACRRPSINTNILEWYKLDDANISKIDSPHDPMSVFLCLK